MGEGWRGEKGHTGDMSSPWLRRWREGGERGARIRLLPQRARELRLAGGGEMDEGGEVQDLIGGCGGEW